MDGYLGLPVAIWSNLILPYLGMHDALSLKLLNKYSVQAFPRFLDSYLSFTSQCKDSTLSLPLYIQAQAEFQRLSSLAYDYLSQNTDRRNIAEIRTLNCPTQSMLDTMEIWITFLTGHKPKDIVREFRLCTDYVQSLRTLTKVPDRAQMKTFLTAHNSQELNRMSLGCGVFVKYLEMMALADEVRMEECEAKVQYWQREETICRKLLQSRS